MKKIRKALFMISLVSSFTFSATFVSLAGTWEYAGDDYWASQSTGWKYWKYKYDDGTYAKDCSVKENGSTYFFNQFGDSNGYGWRNLDKVEALSDEIEEEDERFNGTPIGIWNENYACYTGTVATTSMKLSRQPDGSCELESCVRMTSERNRKGLRGLTYLLCDDDTLYEAIYNSFEEDNDLYNINYDNFVSVGNYQIKATLGDNKRSIIYTIKEN